MKRVRILAKNRSARHDYYIEEKYEAGMSLTGTEIKSIRAGRLNINEAYIRVREGEAYILGMHISPYDFGTYNNVDPIRPRKLLLHKREIAKLEARISQDGLTTIPLSVYLNEDGLAKLEIAVARGKKNYDKRDSIAKEDVKRRIAQAKKR